MVEDFLNLSGKRLGDYELDRRLTSGGMAHIYLARDVQLGRTVAVKVLTPDILEKDPALPTRFLREARAVAQLEHDNIVPIYQYGEQSGLYFLAMRYIDGRDLSQELKSLHARNERIPIPRLLLILSQVASALDYAHRQGIIHRDVKPSNILLGENDKAYLSDFGLVLWQTVEATMGTAFGTPRYISPEQATDSLSVRSQSDLYSLAVVTFEALTGQPVFKGVTPMEIALAHISEPPPSPRLLNENIPQAAEDELLRALEKDPLKRHETVMEFVNALRRAYEDIGTATPLMARPRLEVPTSTPAPTPVLTSLRPAREDSSTIAVRDKQALRTPVPAAPPSSVPRLPLPGRPLSPGLIGGLSVGAFLFIAALLLMVSNQQAANVSATSTAQFVTEQFVIALASTDEAGTAIAATQQFSTALAVTEQFSTALAVAAQQTNEAGATLTSVFTTAVAVAAQQTEAALAAQQTSTRETAEAIMSSTPTPTPSITPSPTATHTSTITPSATATDTPSATPTHTVTPSATPSSTHTPSPTPTHTATDTPTHTPSPTASNTATRRPTATRTPSRTPTTAANAASSATLPPVTAIVRPAATAAASEVAPSPEGDGTLLLRYNTRVFALINPNEEVSLRIAEIVFESLTQPDDSFRNSPDRLGTWLAPGACLVIKLGGSDVPSEWNCQPQREVILSAGVPLFWLADAASDEGFRVLRAEAPRLECPTVGRAVGRIGDVECSAEWPQSSE